MQGGWTERQKERYTKETARVKPKLKITQTKKNTFQSPTVDSLGPEDREVQSLWEIRISLTEVRAPDCPLGLSGPQELDVA